MRSFDDLWETLEQGNDRERVPDLTPVYPTDLSSYPLPIASQMGSGTEATYSGSKQFCGNCLGMGTDKLAQPGGYRHSILSEFIESAKWCELCATMGRSLEIQQAMKCTPDRYQIVVSLEDAGDDAEESPDSTRRRRLRPPTGHGNDRDDFEQNFSRLWLEAMYLGPWEESESYKLRSERKEPQEFFAPYESEPISIRGTWLSCLTEEYDPAIEFGVEYVRQIGSDTCSSRSFEVASSWLASCLATGNPGKLDRWQTPDLRFCHPWPYHGHEAEASNAVVSDTEAVSLPAQDPLRLVEIQQGLSGSAPTIRVIHTNGHQYQYAALSYCWGKA